MGDRLEAERAFARREGQPHRGARERVERLLDAGSFLEVGLLARDLTHDRASKTPADAIITGYGTVDGHRVGVISLDGAVLAGSGGKAGGAKQERIIETALTEGFPVISFGEGGGGRIPDMMGSSLGSVGAIGGESMLLKLAHRDRPFPLISCCVGEMYGDPSFKLGLADFAFMLQDASLAISGPPVIKAALGETVSAHELGGPQVHSRNGQVMRVEPTLDALLDSVRRVLSFILEPHRTSADPADRATAALAELLPANYQRAYNVRKVIAEVMDQDDEPLELWPEFGPTAVACLARLGGRSVGVFANQPMVRGGIFDVEAAKKGSLLLRRCHRFGLPVVFLHDVPGFIIGSQAEAEGMLGVAMEYLRDLSSADVPKLSLVMRKSYGLAYFAMAGPSWGGDYVAALPSARMAFMGTEPGIGLVYAKKLREAADRDAVFEQLREEWDERAEPWEAAYVASIDDVIQPAEARATLIRALRALDRGDRRRR